MSFSGAEDRVDAVNRAAAILAQLRSSYHQMLALVDIWADYDLGTDVPLVAGVQAVFNVAGDRTTLATMIGELETLTDDWTTTYAEALGV